MTYLRPANERGQTNFNWLLSRHSFSFANYYDPKYMGISVLRVINDDQVRGGAGFATHGHRDMEIISYVLSGAIEHEDSLGNRFVLAAGEVQRMSAGTGIIHSEYNHSAKDPLHFLQIWIQPKTMGIAPSYQQARIEQRGSLTALVTADARDNSLSMNQDASLYRLQLSEGESQTLQVTESYAYLQVIQGQARIAGEPLAETTLKAGDALALDESQTIRVVAASSDFEALWFELP